MSSCCSDNQKPETVKTEDNKEGNGKESIGIFKRFFGQKGKADAQTKENPSQEHKDCCG